MLLNEEIIEMCQEFRLKSDGKQSVDTRELNYFLDQLISRNELSVTKNQKLNEWEKKAVEVIKIVDGLSQNEINHIFSLVNYSACQSRINIEFKKQDDVYKCESIINSAVNKNILL